MKILLLFNCLAILYSQLVILCDDVLQIPLNTQFSYPILTTGGQGPFLFLAHGLPNGIVINNDSITGLSSNQGIYPVVLTVQDNNKKTSNKHIFVYVTSSTQINYKNRKDSNTSKQQLQSKQIQTSLIRSQPHIAVSSSNSQQTSISSTTSLHSLQRKNNIGSRTLRTDQSQPSSSLNIGNFISSESFPIHFPFISTTISFQNIQSNSNLNSTKLNNLNSPFINTTSTPILNSGFVFQEQSNINKLISRTLLQIQNSNNILSTISQDIVNTTFLLNKVNQNQKSAHTKLSQIILKNNSINNNMSNLQQNIRTLQNQILFSTKTINNSQTKIQNSQTKIIEYYIKINDTQSRIIQTNNSLQDSKNKQSNAVSAITKSRQIITMLTQNITSVQNHINNAPSQLLRLNIKVNNQKTKILDLQRQLNQAILALVPIQEEVEYYSMIPILGPGQILQNKTLMISQNFNLVQVQPIYEKQKINVQVYTKQINELTINMNKLKTQLQSQYVFYNNIVGEQSKQQNNFFQTLFNISEKTQILNMMRQEQNNLTIVYYNFILNLVSDIALKVKQLNRILDSLNKKYISVQSQLLLAQKKLKEYVEKKELIDKNVDKVIESRKQGLLQSLTSPITYNNQATKLPIKGI